MEPERKPDPVVNDLDPYAPPRDAGPSGSEPDRRSDLVPFDLGCIVATTWLIFKNRPWVSIWIEWTAFIFAVAFSQFQVEVLSRLSPSDPVAYYLVRFAFFFGGFVFLTWMSVGKNLAYLSVARREADATRRFFEGWPYVLTALLASLLPMGVFAGTWFVLPIAANQMAEASGRGMAGIALGLVVALAAMAYIGLRISQYLYFIVDQNFGVLEAFRASWEVTGRGQATMFLLYMTVCVVNLGGLLCFVVGLVITMPFTSLLLAVGYLSITGQPLSPLEPAPESWDDESA